MNHSTRFDRRVFLGQLATGLMLGPSLGASSAARADSPLDISVPLPDDGRLGKLNDLNGYFPFTVPATADEWKHRAELLRRQLLVANGLWPMPPRPPIDATVHGKIEREGYTVERVFFQSSPGLYVTGSLYKPTADGPEKRPAILCPHGHWHNGRFFDHGESKIQDELKSGAEKYPVGGRYPLQARCVQLARMGCIVFHYDMLGYADSVPITQGLGHGFSKQRPAMSEPDHWGLFSAQAELRLFSPMGLQTFNSIRSLDWVSSLPDVDTSRIGVTGASGGGTQTFMLVGLDDRPAAAFPAVMVSTAMQGGCTCENATYLRVGTGNIEIAALCAPRPLGMSAANDWTKELETKGLPELQRLYQMLGVPDLVEGKHFPFGHNYNYVSRAMMYEFFNKHFSLGVESPIVEQDFVPLTTEELTVWTAEHPKPASDEAAEIKALSWLAAESDKQIAALVPHKPEGIDEFRRIVGGGWEVMIGRDMPDADQIIVDIVRTEELPTAKARIGYLNFEAKGESVPTIHLSSGAPAGRLVLWITPDGKQGLFNGGEPIPAVQTLLDAGVHVVGLDLLYQGDSLAPDRSATRSRSTENGREAACFVYGYNHPLFSQRVHDILSAVGRAHSLVERVDLVGTRGAGPWVAAAAFLAREAVASLAVSTEGFRFGQITDIRDPQLLPGAVKYGDVPALLGLCAPTPMWLGGEGLHVPEVTAACYHASGADGAVAPVLCSSEEESAKIVEWLLQS